MLLEEVWVVVEVGKNDLVQINGKTAASGRKLKIPAGRYRTELLREGKVVQVRYLDIRNHCTLREPLACDTR